jgi:hypothetical protein
MTAGPAIDCRAQQRSTWQRSAGQALTAALRVAPDVKIPVAPGNHQVVISALAPSHSLARVTKFDNEGSKKVNDQAVEGRQCKADSIACQNVERAASPWLRRRRVTRLSEELRGWLPGALVIPPSC